MIATTKKLRPEAWARAYIDGLFIFGSLSGSTHHFEFDGKRASVSIPKIGFEEDGRPLNEELASFRAGRTDDLRPEISEYELGWVEVTIQCSNELLIPTSMLKVSPKRPELAGPKLNEILDKLVLDYQVQLASVLEYWSETVRWVTDSSSIGMEDRFLDKDFSPNLQLMCLRDPIDGHRFWLPTTRLTFGRISSLGVEDWGRIQLALSQKKQSPIWFNYLHDAVHRMSRLDYSGAIISAAIACETIMRDCFYVHSNMIEDQTVRDIIDRISISSILRKWKIVTGISNISCDHSMIEALFSARNRQMHRGGRGLVLDADGASKLINSAKKFVRTGDEWYFNSTGTDNPRLRAS